ncbi:hypothetical protein BB560_001681 [Smittium megazygosporum]|uniref:C2H2-type domain-containing protein n=1 Tax=Smittium megazygosporum TaxID=133381 RepID=A0A2T9ZGU9_9FUNG|nr:hypothetical protein BB560_001681 [Smittium megazygosporum]
MSCALDKSIKYSSYLERDLTYKPFNYPRRYPSYKGSQIAHFINLPDLGKMKEFKYSPDSKNEFEPDLDSKNRFFHYEYSRHSDSRYSYITPYQGIIDFPESHDLLQNSDLEPNTQKPGSPVRVQRHRYSSISSNTSPYEDVRCFNRTARKSHICLLVNEHDVDPIPQTSRLRGYSESQPENDYESSIDCSIDDSFEMESIKSYRCQWNHCSHYFMDLGTLMDHIDESHIGKGKSLYFCEWENCKREKSFQKRHKIVNHLKAHLGYKPYICTIDMCNKTFSRPDSLQTHMKTHSGFKPYVCQYENCNKAYFHSRSLRKHQKSHTRASQKFKSDVNL